MFTAVSTEERYSVLGGRNDPEMGGGAGGGAGGGGGGGGGYSGVSEGNIGAAREVVGMLGDVFTAPSRPRRERGNGGWTRED